MKISVPAQRIRHQRATPPNGHNLYFAYGSNLNVEHMRRRCPDADPLAPVTVNHLQLVFRGVADVTIRKSAATPGGLWQITEACERALDSFEGVSSRIYLKRFFTVRINGQLRDVLMYQMQTSRGVMPPSEAYLQTITDGYGDFGLDRQALDEALRRSWDERDVTAFMRDRYERRGRPKLARRVPDPDPTIPDFVLSEEDLLEAGAI